MEKKGVEGPRVASGAHAIAMGAGAIASKANAIAVGPSAIASAASASHLGPGRGEGNTRDSRDEPTELRSRR